MRRGRLETKLPSRHPVQAAPVPESSLRLLGMRVSAFVYSQAFMVPLVLFNQLCVWPLVSMLVVWPQWAQNHARWAEWGWAKALPTLVVLMLISDQMWYWSHRLMHTKWAWKHLHKMHHVAPQCAISATYVHPLEYMLFTISMQLPFAVAGFPMWVHIVPLSWGMLTGSGAHSGYGGDFANGEKHNMHHYATDVNFGLLMIADMIWGTHWQPGDPLPLNLQDPKTAEIASAYTHVWGEAALLKEYRADEVVPEGASESKKAV